MSDTIDIFVGDVSDIEARVYAKYQALSATDDSVGERTEISGVLRGPFCATASTLPAGFEFRMIDKSIPVEQHAVSNRTNSALAEVIVPDPCLWSPELPHVYHIDVEARRQGRLVAEYHGQIGLRRTTPRREGIQFPG